MPQLHLSDLLSLDADGPTAESPDGEPQLVFLRQGDMDGACGPYSLMISLLICGVISRDDVTGLWEIDRRTGLGKLMARLEQRSGLIRSGTDLSDLEEDIQGLFRSQLSSEGCTASGVEVRSFVYEHISEGHPVILGLEGSDYSHWAVVVGYEQTAEHDLTRLLLLDPSGPPPVVTAWNAVVDVRGTGGIYPYRYWGFGSPAGARLAHALAIWPNWA